MFRQLNWRLLLILLISVISIVMVLPTARYFTFVSTTPHPAIGSDAEKAYDDQIQNLKARSITPGLDLQGGVDILLSVDQNKTENDNLVKIVDQLKKRFRKDSIDATFDVDSQTNTFQFRILNTKDFRQAKNILDEYKGVFEDFDSAPLQEGDVVNLRLSPKILEQYFESAIQGSEKVLRNRVNEFGLTQALIVRQGDTRIRVQIPGEKDPQRVIQNMLKPAQLEFRLVSDENAQKAQQLVETKEENGKTIQTVKTEEVPPGYKIFFGEVNERDPHRIGIKVSKTIPYLLKDEVPLTGATLEETYVEVVQSDLESPIHINLVFNREGARKFKDITEQNRGKNLAILLDGVVYTAPRIKDVIPNGRCYISGSFDMEEAREISQVLKAGSMPAKLQVEHKQAVGATLGTDTIKASVKALIVGGALVIIFMILYYGTAGVIADIALIINVIMILAVLSLGKATLTLSGIGGILLTIGMAVDANVLIYERIREEMKEGKGIKLAVKRGFERAFVVIWDSNFTTLITALILLQFAVGSVKGFALTMAIGLLVNLYTGMGVTHCFTDMWVSWKNKINLGFLQIFRDTKFDFMKLRKGALVISGAFILMSLFTLIANKGPHYAVDFEGGILTQVKFTDKVSGEDIRSSLMKAGAPFVSLQRVTGSNEFILKMKMIDNDGAKTEDFILNTLKTTFGEGKFEIRSTQNVGNEIGEEFRTIAVRSVLIASLAILIYIGFRFQFVFGMGAVAALIHDILITIGILTILGREISLDVVSALLIILGYSINDTIVIFDRIRENMRTQYGKNFGEIANLSINQSLNRTTLTAGTTFIPMLIMYLIGGKGLVDFSFTICIGIIIGTYSSSFVATPIVYEWMKRKGFKTAEETTRKTHYHTVEPLNDAR
ncbi:protein translocase subunit SecD [Candidatus Sumerlaeota bacterium]|nr:protein translocase subunit SecD [Candidatus Sumerlaeota bacterium]